MEEPEKQEEDYMHTFINTQFEKHTFINTQFFFEKKRASHNMLVPLFQG